jgi:beta-lactamase class A
VLSVVVAPLGAGPVFVRNPDVTHDAVSTVKVAVLAALHRSGLKLNVPVPVVNRFSSVAGGEYANDAGFDSDPEPWRLLGGTATLRWLAERMIIHSSNLATNLCLTQVGLAAVGEVWRRAGATHSVTSRGIEDYAARDAGIANLVTAADLVRLFQSLEPELHGVLERNAHRVDLAAGLPAGTRIAFKNGWFPGVRHSAGIVYPPDARPYVIAVCYRGSLASGHAVDDPAARLVSRISAWTWSGRPVLGSVTSGHEKRSITPR